jgi:hypothetical protein
MDQPTESISPRNAPNRVGARKSVVRVELRVRQGGQLVATISR